MAGSRAELAALAERWVAAGWQRGDTVGVLAMYTPDFVDRGNPAGRPGTGAENVAGIRALYDAFPDFSATIDELVIDEHAGRVAVRWSATGTHRGPFLGAHATNGQIAFRGIEILQLRDGLIAERSGEWDAEALLRQLGVIA